MADHVLLIELCKFPIRCLVVLLLTNIARSLSDVKTKNVFFFRLLLFSFAVRVAGLLTAINTKHNTSDSHITNGWTVKNETNNKTKNASKMNIKRAVQVHIHQTTINTTKQKRTKKKKTKNRQKEIKLM